MVNQVQASPGAGKSARATTRSSISSAAREVWLNSSLRQALGENADDLLLDASEKVFKRGEVFYDMTRADPARLYMVTEGLVRVYYASVQGRQATVRYATPGKAIGLPVILAPKIVAIDRTLATQALSTCRVLELSPSVFRRIAESDARNMWPLFNELTSMLTDSQVILSQNVFQPVRVRVARHMLDLAIERGGDLVVTASQQDIADAIGSVREVVSRVVVQLRDEGFLRRAEGAYVIVNPAALHMISESE